MNFVVLADEKCVTGWCARCNVLDLIVNMCGNVYFIVFFDASNNGNGGGYIRLDYFVFMEPLLPIRIDMHMGKNTN